LKGAFISDCEGPISKNDNAFEVMAHYVPRGDKIFSIISKYDDLLSDILNRPCYRSGYTLKLILPFLKAYGVTNRKMREFSARNLLLIPNVKDSFTYIRRITKAFIVSTSYEHYIKAVCHAIDFPYENTYSTKVNVDDYVLPEEENEKLKELAFEISTMPIIKIPSKPTLLSNLPDEQQNIVRRLDEIFGQEFADMEAGKIFSKVNPIGGEQKACAVRDAAQKAGVRLSDLIYVGDSITDVDAFKLVKENGGLTVSFNGNEYAVRNAEIAILSQHSIVTAIIADIFNRLGKQKTMELIEAWDYETLRRSPADRLLINSLLKQHPEKLPKVKIVTRKNVQILSEESNEFRKMVRGEAIGRLG